MNHPTRLRSTVIILVIVLGVLAPLAITVFPTIFPNVSATTIPTFSQKPITIACPPFCISSQSSQQPPPGQGGVSTFFCDPNDPYSPCYNPYGGYGPYPNQQVTTATTSLSFTSTVTSSVTSVSTDTLTQTQTTTSVFSTTSTAGLVPGLDPSLNTPLLIVAIILGAIIGVAVTKSLSWRSTAQGGAPLGSSPRRSAPVGGEDAPLGSNDAPLSSVKPQSKTVNLKNAFCPGCGGQLPRHYPSCPINDSKNISDDAAKGQANS